MRRRRPLVPRVDLETRLWARLRELEGHRFRRHAPFRTFTLDFVEHDARLVISLEAGAPGSRSPVHIVRDRLLREQGYVILRLWREEVLRDLGGAIQRIRSVLDDLSAFDSG
jgi:crossover junction endodeoxyribonuclease RuvC